MRGFEGVHAYALKYTHIARRDKPNGLPGASDTRPLRQNRFAGLRTAQNQSRGSPMNSVVSTADGSSEKYGLALTNHQKRLKISARRLEEVNGADRPGQLAIAELSRVERYGVGDQPR